MKGRNMSQRDYRVGRRVVAGRDPVRGAGLPIAGGHDVSYGELRIETIESIDEDARSRGWNAQMVLAHPGGRRTVLLCNGSIKDDAVETTPWRTLWTDPLPDDDAAALAMVGAVHSTDGYRDVALLWIASVDAGGVAYAHVLTEERDADGVTLLRGVGTLSCTTAAIAVQGDEPMEAGSLIAARPNGSKVDSGRVVHEVANAVTVLRGVDLADAASSIPVIAGTGRGRPVGNLAQWYVFAEAEQRALAMEQDSEALTLCWSEGGPLEVTCLAKTGIDFWRNDDPEDFARQTVPGPGLWMWRNVRYRSYQDHEGVWDGDMQGDWAPATIDDVLRMAGSVDAVADDIRHYSGSLHEEPVQSEIAAATTLAEVRAAA